MDVGINVALRGAGAGYRQTGVGRYVYELERALRATMQPGDSLVALGGKAGPVSRRAPVRIAWEQTAMAVDIARRRLDAFHGPVNTLPMVLRAPGIVTVHDLAFLRYPQVVPLARRAWLVGAIRHSARAADRVIAISQHTADDLVSWLDLPHDRITVIPLAVSPSIRRLTGAELQVFRLKYRIERPYVLAVGTMEPRKNLSMLLHAFAAIRDEVPHRLVLVGPEGWMTGELHATIANLALGDRLVLTGFVDDDALGGWYSAADLVAFPSLYEGFGLPVLEAMACGAPVLASEASALLEVGGDAAIYAQAGDVSAWAEAMRGLLVDSGRRAEMSEAGLARAATFSWERTARETWRVYREVSR